GPGRRQGLCRCRQPDHAEFGQGLYRPEGGRDGDQCRPELPAQRGQRPVPRGEPAHGPDRRDGRGDVADGVQHAGHRHAQPRGCGCRRLPRSGRAVGGLLAFAVAQREPHRRRRGERQRGLRRRGRGLRLVSASGGIGTMSEKTGACGRRSSLRVRRGVRKNCRTEPHHAGAVVPLVGVARYSGRPIGDGSQARVRRMLTTAAAGETSTATEGREAAVCALLVARGRLKDGDLTRARRLHEEATEGTLTALLARLGLVNERELAEAWSELLAVPMLAAREAPELAPPDLDLSLRFLKQQHVVPVSDGGHGLALLMADPADPYPLQAVTLAAGRPVALRIGLRSEIDDLIERYYGSGRSAMGTIVENIDGGASEVDDVEHLRDLASEAPVIRLVNLILQRAVEQRASDVHIEPFENRLK